MDNKLTPLADKDFSEEVVYHEASGQWHATWNAKPTMQKIVPGIIGKNKNTCRVLCQKAPDDVTKGVMKKPASSASKDNDMGEQQVEDTGGQPEDTGGDVGDGEEQDEDVTIGKFVE